jgi:hypothetical protein
MNFVLFFAQIMRKMWLLYEFGIIIAFLGLFYQTISVTISYLEYETVIDMKAVLGIEQRPALTFCLYSDTEFPIRIRNPFMNQEFGNSFGCYLVFLNSTAELLKCDHLSKLVESVTPFSHRCLSLYSHLLNEKIMRTNGTYFRVMVDDNLKIFALIHQSGTPPHFTRNKLEIINSSTTLIDCYSIITKLLPFPHSTDCYDYRREAKLVNGYNSREDCVLKLLERKELAKCGCNKKWSYRAFNKRNFSHICPESVTSVKCDFDSKIIMKSLEKICKNNCYDEYYLDEKSLTQNMYKDYDIKLFGLWKDPKYDIIFTYLVKMNFVEYLCSVGGLVSMWFGISVYDFALILVNEPKKWLIRLFGSINCENFTLIVLKFKEIISKFDGILSKLTIIFFSILMLYQLFEVITIYLNYETVTPFEVQQIMFLPKFRTIKQLMLSNMNELMKIYPEMKREILSFDEFENQQTFENGLKKLLLDNRINGFHRIAETEKIFKTCHFVINNKLINCSKVDTGVFYTISDLMIFNELNYSGIVDKSEIEK